MTNEKYQLFIGGRWCGGSKQRLVTVYNPATSEQLAEVALADEEDVIRAISSAKAAFGSWSKVDPKERGRLVTKLGRMLESKIEEFALMDTLNAGHPINSMRADAKNAAEGLQRVGVLSETLKGESSPATSNRVSLVLREPYGVVAAIAPFNHPIHFACKKIGPALVAGNTVVLKPSTITPISALELGKYIEQLFPPGVVNIIVGNGSSVGKTLASHPDVRRITLTGGVSTGKQIMSMASATLKFCTFELGGKNPMIVYPDADIERAVDGAVEGMNFTSVAGQSCQSTSRLFLHAGIYEDFIERLVSKVSKIKIGMPTKEETEMGSLSSKSQYDKVMQYIDLAKAEGAHLLTGGGRPEGPEFANGYFIQPTIFGDVTNEMRIAKEEIFGPVLSVLKWTDPITVFEWANDSLYGLTGSIWTRSLDAALLGAKNLDTAYVWVNSTSKMYPGAPKSGHKQSGPGFEDLLSFTQIKNIDIRLN
ncbi:MAG: aldehyde dehydrogenase family protein [Nitrososphaerales archaeon]